MERQALVYNETVNNAMKEKLKEKRKNCSQRKWQLILSKPEIHLVFWTLFPLWQQNTLNFHCEVQSKRDVEEKVNVNFNTHIDVYNYMFFLVSTSNLWRWNWYRVPKRRQTTYWRRGVESSSPYPQVPAICPYPEPTPSSPHHPLQLPEDLS
jgi:hypothetical protein